MATSRFDLPGDGLLAAQVCFDQRMPAGDPARLRSAARRSDAWAAELRRTVPALLSYADTPLWSGVAHRAFAEHIRSHTPSMSATAERYEHYASALNAYAGVLDQTAPRLFAVRTRLRQRYDEITSGAHAMVSCAVAAPPASRPAHGTAELLAMAWEFKAGYDRWADALDSCIRALFQADDGDRTRDVHGFAALGHVVADAAGTYLSPFERAALHPSLHNLSDCLGSLNLTLTALGLGLLFVCPPAATACLVAATVLAVAQVSVDATRRARGEHVSATSLGLGLAAAVPLGGSAVRGVRATGEVVHLVPGGGLMAHEGLEGGHTLAKHVGKSEAFLRNRLATEPHLDVVSTFYDREVAENALSHLLEVNARPVQRWLAHGSRSLVLVGRMPHPLGVAIRREVPDPVEAFRVKAVLKRSATMATGYRIHTAMVEL
jgi:uncharacterized protein YukE